MVSDIKAWREITRHVVLPLSPGFRLAPSKESKVAEDCAISLVTLYDDLAIASVLAS
jgi:hypothetical protein